MRGIDTATQYRVLGPVVAYFGILWIGGLTTGVLGMYNYITETVLLAAAVVISGIWILVGLGYELKLWIKSRRKKREEDENYVAIF